jgi:predicted transcriptional regulator
MPWSPPEVHPSDGFYTHVVGGSDRPCAESHGLFVQLGQALTALTLQHEEDALVSLPTGANFLRLIDAGPVTMRDLVVLSGLSKEAMAMATKHLARTGLARIHPDRSISLTRTGRDALHDYRERAGRPRNEALRASLDSILSERELLAAGLVPPEGGWRGTKPYLAQTKRILADPIQALPWHPMVLHRGGWPDGS